MAPGVNECEGQSHMQQIEQASGRPHNELYSRHTAKSCADLQDRSPQITGNRDANSQTQKRFAGCLIDQRKKRSN